MGRDIRAQHHDALVVVAERLQRPVGGRAVGLDCRAWFDGCLNKRYDRRVSVRFDPTQANATEPFSAYFSDRGRLFQSDRGRRNGVAGVALG